MKNSNIRGPLTESEIRWRDQFIRKLESISAEGIIETDFLDPLQLELAEGAVKANPHLSSIAFGGYEGAERLCLKVFPASLAVSPPRISCLQVKGPFKENNLTHRDLLGSVLGLGLRRDQVGDILIFSDDRSAIMVPESKGGLICSQLSRIGSVPVECTLVDASELPLPGKEGREIMGTVAGMRLDSIISLGFGLSRSRAAMLVKGGLSRVNWRPVASASHKVQEGDLISLQGKGRLEVLTVEGETRKGRIRLKLKKFM